MEILDESSLKHEHTHYVIRYGREAVRGTESAAEISV